MTDVESQAVPMEDEQMGEDTLEMFFSKLEELNTLTKWFNKQGKAIVKKSAKPRKRSPNKGGNGKSGFSVPVRVAPSLATFLGLNPSEHIARTEVTKRLTSYIKDKNLQCEENKKHFLCDEALASVFAVDKGYQTNWFEMQKFLSKLLVSVKKEVETDHAAPSDIPAPAAGIPEKKRPEAAKPEAPKTKKLKKVA